MKLKRFATKDISAVSNLWIQSFSENLLSRLGKKIIISYLIEYLKNKKNKGFVLKKKDQIIAFVLYGNEGKIVNQIFVRNFIDIFLTLIKYILMLDIKNIMLFFNVLIFTIILKINNPILKNTTELLIVVVNKNLQGKGYGKFLIKESLKDKYFKPNMNVFVKTVDNTNQKVKFYKKLKFKYRAKIFNRTFLKLEKNNSRAH